VKIYEFYQDKKNLYLIQEYIAGGDLFEKIKNSKGGFEENTAALIMKQVLSAVFYCHKNGVVHRDLKPENILLEDSNNFNNIKVIDFGTSRNF
jgi:calcium-dependent protein kinase